MPLGALAHTPAPSAMRSVTDFGVSATNADNTSQFNAAIQWALTNHARIWNPFPITIAGTLVVNGSTVPQGFEIDGPGQITETGNNLPIFHFIAPAGGYMEAIYVHNIAMIYANYQGTSEPNSACMAFDADTAGGSIYNSRFDRIQCYGARKGFAQVGSNGNMWGNRWTNLICKRIAGACLDMQVGNGGQPNNYFGNVYAINSSCADPYQFAFKLHTTLNLDNFEVNNISGCRLLYVAKGRSINIRNIRCEVCAVGTESVNGGLIEADGVGIHIEGFEAQQISPNMPGSNFFLFQDSATSGPPDVVTNVQYWNRATVTGTIYGVSSPTVHVYLQPVTNWQSAPYGGDVAPGSNVTTIWAP